MKSHLLADFNLFIFKLDLGGSVQKGGNHDFSLAININKI